MFDSNPKPLTASPNPESKSPNTTFFYEQPNGRIIAVEEEQAYLVHKKFKQIGVSDGTFFQEAVKEAKRIHKETGDLAKAQEILRQGERDELEIARGHFQVPRNFGYTNRQNIPVDRNQNPVPPNRRT